MREFFEVVSQHSEVSFWLGVFVLIALLIVCRTLVRLVRGYALTDSSVESIETEKAENVGYIQRRTTDEPD